MYLPYVIPMIIAVALAFQWGDSRAKRAALAIAGVWAIGTTFVVLSIRFGSPVYTPFALFFVLDFIAARIILLRPAGRFGAIMATTFVIQMAMHTGYAARQFVGIADANEYLFYLDIVAWAQLALLVGWSLGHGFGRPIGNRFFARHPAARKLARWRVE